LSWRDPRGSHSEPECSSATHGPLAASTFAGVFGAGVVDAAVTLARGAWRPRAGVTPFAGLYGVAALALAVVIGLFRGGILARSAAQARCAPSPRSP
jgi:hypothetical protein